jgi:hypothetical protein
LVNNAYYASGLTICNFARQLGDPGVQDEVVDRGTRLLDGDLRMFNTPLFPLDEVFEPVFQDAYDRTDERVQLLGNYLWTVREIRRISEGSAPTLHSPTVVENVYEQMYGAEPPILKERLRAITVSPPDIITTILKQRGVDLSTGQLPGENDIAKLRHPSLVQVARRLCMLTSPESKGEHGQVIDAHTESVEFMPPVDGRPNFFSSKSTVTSGDDSFQVVKTLPMVCPALHVQGAVPEVMGLTIKILESAAREARLDKTGFKVYNSLEGLIIP